MARPILKKTRLKALMENSEGILKFRSLNIVEYLNSKHPAYEDAAIEEAKHELSSLLKQVDKDMYGYFLEKSDSLLNLLNIYQRCYIALSNFKASRVFYEDGHDEVEAVGSDDFKKKCRLFVEDMSIFVIDERYLVSAEHFNDGEILCVLTNDLLFIGENVGNGRYSLRRSVHKGSIKMEVGKDTLSLTIEGGVCILSGSRRAVEDLYEAFQEISYEYIPENREEHFLDMDYVNFCVETRRFEELSTHINLSGNKRDRLSLVIDGLEVNDESELQALMALHRNPSRFFKTFFLRRFREGLASINRIQKVGGFLDDVFSFLQSFSRSFVEYCTNHDINRGVCVLCMEECVLEVFSALEGRIFSGFAVRNTQSIIESARDRLRFDNMDFRYLSRRLEERRASYVSKYLDRCKNEIRQKLESFWNEK